MRVYQFRHVGIGAAFIITALLQHRALESTRYGVAVLRTAADLHPVVVPTEGLEPPHLAAHGPEPCASTNSATWAFLLLGYCNLPKLIQYQALLFFARSTFAAPAPDFPTILPAFSFALTCCPCERAEIIAERLQKSKTAPGARFVRRILLSSVTLRLLKVSI